MCRPSNFNFSIEIDVSFSSVDDIAGLGFGLEDQHRILVAAGCRILKANSVLQAECEAILEALWFATKVAS